ncbi:MAG: hypothetical protein KGN78_14260 [Actinomycetales bacterium]|nr:hypothetical protein [Actinomycetales bacterium]
MPAMRLYDHVVEQAVLVTPIWQPQLDTQAAGFLRMTHTTNAQMPTIFLAPSTLDLGFYREHFPHTDVLTFDSRHFTSVAAYSAWMTTPEVYEALSGPTWMVLCQTDAVIIRSLTDLDLTFSRSSSPIDYVGSVWSPPVRVLALGTRLVIDSPTGATRGPWFARVLGRRLRVGNGGLSIRRIERFRTVAARLTRELPRRIVENCYEDVLFCTYGPSRGLRIASPAQASTVFSETEVVGCSVLPDTYGFHALPRWNPILADALLKQVADG